MISMREIVFDTETTGTDHENGDRMVEIGCIEMIDRVMTGRTYHCYFNPERAMDPGAERVHGLGDAFLKDKPRFNEKARELLEFIGGVSLYCRALARLRRFVGMFVVAHT